MTYSFKTCKSIGYIIFKPKKLEFLQENKVRTVSSR